MSSTLFGGLEAGCAGDRAGSVASRRRRQNGKVSGMMSRNVVVRACALVGLASACATGWGAESTQPPDIRAPERVPWTDAAKHPCPFLSWGADLRIRQEYSKNVSDFDDHQLDGRNVLRTRYRLWTTFGPFLRDKGIEAPNGLSLYARLAYEPRYYLTYQTTGVKPPYPDWDEVAVDNLYLDWQRVGGLPVSLRVGRQDLAYGRGLILQEGTPLDGSRTAYFDACKATLHLDNLKSTLDLLCIHNRGDESDRLRPYRWDDVRKPVCEYDMDARGLYFRSNYLEDHELGFYYLYTREKPLEAFDAPPFTRNRVHTVGLPLTGRMGPWDYYAELACQWGRHGEARQRARAFASDLGYTFRDLAWTPRLHASYEYFSGDDPHTGRHEGWDPLFGRWSRTSEIVAGHFARDYRQTSYWTNTQSCLVGVSARPVNLLTLGLDYGYYLANEHDQGNGPPFGHGNVRGQLCLGKIIYGLSPHCKMHLWAECFRPGSYYARRDKATYLRWDILFTF